MNFNLECTGINIAISLDFIDFYDISKMLFWLQRFCPCIRLADKEIAHYKIICKKSTTNRCLIKEDKAILSGVWKNFDSFLAKFITQVFEKFLIDRNFFILPAACVSYENKCVLILGDYWQGKSSTAINLKKFNNKFSLVSDNYVLFNNNKIIGGTKYISFQNKNLYEINGMNNNKKLLEVNNRKFYEISTNDDSSLSLDIAGLIIPFINSSDNNFHVVPDEESKWYLYQKFSKLLNGESILFNSKLVSPRLGSTCHLQKILDTVNNINSSIKLHYASASIPSIVKYVCKNFLEDFKNEY